MVNYLALTGALEHDPEMSYLGDDHDQSEANFILVFQSGLSRTGHIRVTCYNRLAELVGRYLHQGARLTVSGVLDQEQDLTADEQEKSGFRLIARSLEVIPTDRRGHTSFTPLESDLRRKRLSGDGTQDDPGRGSD